MNHSHKTGIERRVNQLDRIIKIEEANQLPKEAENELFERIRNGDETAVETFIACHDRYILKIAKQVGILIPIEDVLRIGRTKLHKLAMQELNSSSRERYYRFFAWCLRQALLRGSGDEKEC